MRGAVCVVLIGLLLTGAPLILYSSAGEPASATFETLTATQQQLMRREHDVACQLEKGARLTTYRAGPSAGSPRALYTSKSLPGQVRSGKHTVALTEEDIAAVIKHVGWTVPRRVQKHEAVAAVASGSAFYSFHRRYDVVSGLLRQEALVLHDANRRILAYELVTHRAADLCDGCGLPSLQEGFSISYRVENVFELPGFPYPVLLLDTSTVEGRALSLATFSDRLRIADFRLYEYIANCTEG